jgi:hypothetical protein
MSNSFGVHDLFWPAEPLSRLRARARPARTRSLSRILSCFAIVARMEMTASLKIPQESKYGSVKLR